MTKILNLILFSLITPYLIGQIIIEDSVFTTTSLDIIGSEWNHAIIKNCTFKNTILNDGIRIANANNVIIDNCTFYNIQGNGILLHNSGTSNGVIIKNCTFDSIYANGILASENHKNTQIINNQMNYIGLDEIQATIGQPHHGIYFQGNNFYIEGNRIKNIHNNDGNCISVRSNGVVRNNVLSNATKNGITYYSDHPNVGKTLLIENNITYNCMRGIAITNGGESYVDSVIVRFNTFITDNKMNVSIGPNLSMKIEIYGNIFIRKDGSPIYIYNESSSSYTSTLNLTSSGDIGFVDFENHNYHITESSQANSYAIGLIQFPPDDFEGDTRSYANLDVGADQFNEVTSSAISFKLRKIKVYPNPSSRYVIIESENDIQKLTLSDVSGKIVDVRYNQNSIDLSELKKGIYFLYIETNREQLIKKITRN